MGSRDLDVLNAFKDFFFFFHSHTVVFRKWGEGQRTAAALGPQRGRLERVGRSQGPLPRAVQCR